MIDIAVLSCYCYQPSSHLWRHFHILAGNVPSHTANVTLQLLTLEHFEQCVPAFEICTHWTIRSGENGNTAFTAAMMSTTR